MLTPHQYYRRVAFGITKENDLQNPLEDSIKQLTNTDSVSWNHTNPTNLDAIKYGVNLKYIENKVSEEGGNHVDRMKAFKEAGMVLDPQIEYLPFRAHNAIHGPSPVLDRFQFFWGNHMPVHGRAVNAVADTYHRKIIRDSLTGSFNDLIKNTVTSEAMMKYHDNVDNLDPDSPYSKKHPNQKVGFNENLAREVMELFTISPDAGYTQKDVVNATKILSGWGGDRKWMKDKWRGLGDMYFPIVFRKDSHSKGVKTVLGKKYEGGEKELFEFIDDLCNMDECAQFISTKLAIHYIADNPPKEAVEHIKSTFKKSSGHLPSIHQATLEAVSKYAEAHQKVSWPEIWLIQAMNIFNFRLYPLDPANDDQDPLSCQQYRTLLEKIGNNPLDHGQPNGYADLAEDWLSSELLDRRIIISMKIQELTRNIMDKNLLENVSFAMPDSQTLTELASSNMDPNALVKILCHRDFIRI